MEDEGIVRLYFERNEDAIGQTARKYGGFCQQLALNILSSREDAEECVNDTYFAAWDKIPPARPRSLRAFLGRIVRNLSISRFRANHAQKRYAGLEIMLSELDECLPDHGTVEQAVDRALLGQTISRWLRSLTDEDQFVFLRRYWYGDGVNALANELGWTPNQVSQRLFRMRKSLKKLLEEGEFL